MSGYALALIMLIQSAAPAAPRDDIKESLARAEALYFEARFSDSIQLLARVSDDLQSRPDRMPDKIHTKLQLALANIGLNDTEKAKGYLVDMYTLDPNTVLDPQEYSPKVIALAAEAKASMVKIRCQAIGDDVRTSLKEGNAAAIRRLLGSPDAKCVDMAAIGGDAADVLYKAGLESYKNSDYSTALQNFQAAVKFSPKHELAAQYAELAQARLQVVEDKTLIQWQQNFDAHKFADAAANYRQIASFNDNNGGNSGRNSAAVRQAGDQYRKVLTTLVETWNLTCPGGDESAMNDIRSQISELLPEPSFGADLRAQMMPCDKPVIVKPSQVAAAPPDVKTTARTVALNIPSAPSGPPAAPAAVFTVAPAPSVIANLPAPQIDCLQMDYRVAMTRLKTRVEPEIPREARPYIQSNPVTVKVKVRISENGTVMSSDTPSGNPVFNTAVKNAVERWKFSPAIDTNGPRCVDTEIPVVFGPLNAR